MRVEKITVVDTPAGARLQATVRREGRRARQEVLEFVYGGIPANALSTPGDALLATVLLPAMAAGEDVAIDCAVSALLLANVDRIVDIWAGWRPRWRRSVVAATAVERSPTATAAVGACFSGGVDSFFTALRPRDEQVSILLTMIGFTAYDELRPRMPEAIPALARAANALGKRHVAVDSNAFEFGQRYLPGSEHHGAVAAAMALGLGSLVRRCYIAASWPLGLLRPWGSHPDLDPLWSTEAVDIVHDGAEFTRFEKVKAIADSDVVLETLRVCTRRRPYPENCRTCDKCQATGLMLRVAGALGRSQTLGPVTPRSIRRTIIRESIENYFTDLLVAVDDPEFARAIAVARRRSHLRRYAHPVGRVLRRVGLRK